MGGAETCLPFWQSSGDGIPWGGSSWDIEELTLSEWGGESHTIGELDQAMYTINTLGKAMSGKTEPTQTSATNMLNQIGQKI